MSHLPAAESRELKARDLKLIGAVRCKQYNCEAVFYVDAAHSGGRKHLIARYGEGYTGRDDLPIADGRPEFRTAIPEELSEQELHSLLLEPMNPATPYPAWEVPARGYGSPELFRWWAGEEPR